MKKNLSAFKIATQTLLVVFMICLPSLEQAYAQVYVPASTAETYIVTDGIQNSALIDYTPNCTAVGGCGVSQLKVVGASGGVIVDDGLGGPVTLSGSYGNSDVIVGNDTSTTTDYLVGVLYISGAGLYLDIYDISNVGTGSALSASGPTTYTIASTISVTFAHIDIIADYGTSFLGLPLCNKFVIAYENSSASIVGYSSSLNNPSVSTSQTITSPGTSYQEPDVAAIRRYRAGSHSTVIDDVALFTYITASTGIYYREWDISTGALSTQATLSTTSAHLPRIEAIDDYHINDPTIASPLAYYTITNDNRGQLVKVYNNKLPAGGLDISTPLIGSSNTVTQPSIAAGPCEQYTVAFPTSYGQPDVIAMNIDWTTGYPVNYGTLPNPFLNVNYYETNLNSVTGSFTAIATATCNSTGPSYATNLLTDWNESGDLYDKLTDCSMAFKPAAVPNVSKNGQWSLAPNPATDVVVLTNDNATPGATYNITDITGKVVGYAVVTSGRQQIDVSQMAPGMYLLTVYNNGQNTQTIKFVKD